MDITWNELLNNNQDKRIEILATMYAEYQEFKQYQILLKQASLERASDNLKAESIVNIETVELENMHH
ncbi:MAG: hypothetical protein IPI45_13620 [Saprospiraceae bacterium]|nr:hypothetical protein [Saprospiraceae bacterium]MBK7738806.1 hypothetical protein [Saprospiraceae bacterium]MBK7912622.1 hypothetical protein [Saprospiraceae bacterium]